ncbi:MAG TPA: asparagine synthase-related protein, partial [Burkholderiaceae bacterium]
RHAHEPMPDRMHSNNLLQQLGAEQVFEPAFLRQIDQGAQARQHREVWATAQTGNLVNRMLAYDWRYTLAESDLPKVRGATQMADIEVAYPLLSDDLTEFSLSIPPAWKLRGFKLRWFFKEALRGFLPDEILSKKKHGFGLPFGVWAHRDPALAKIMRESLQSLASRGLIRPGFVKHLLEEQLPKHPGYYGEMVWILLALEHWLQSAAPDFKLA